MTGKCMGVFKRRPAIGIMWPRLQLGQILSTSRYNTAELNIIQNVLLLYTQYLYIRIYIIYIYLFIFIFILIFVYSYTSCFSILLNSALFSGRHYNSVKSEQSFTEIGIRHQPQLQLQNVLKRKCQSNHQSAIQSPEMVLRLWYNCWMGFLQGW